jgi:hypothetical protein
MILYLLKVHLQTFLSIPTTQKCQVLSCVTLVANERHVLLAKYFSGYQIETNEIGWACSTCGGGRGEMRMGFWWGDLRGGDHLEDAGVDGSIILKWAMQGVS